MRKWGSAVLAAALLASTASFAGTEVQGALAPGHAAGVQKAQTFTPPVVLALVSVAVGVGIVAVVLSNNGHGSVTTTTSGTP